MEDCMKQVELSTPKPFLRLLLEEHCKHVHSASMEILEYHGIRMLDPEGKDLLLSAGALAREDHWIGIPSVLVKQALNTAPGRIVLANQKGERTLFLEDTNVYFGPGSDTVFTDDIDTGERRETLRSDVGRMAKLCDALSNIDFLMSMGIPRDVPTTATYLYEFAEMVMNSNKPVVFTADAPGDIDDIYEMACAVAGGHEALRENPFLLHYAEPISPLLFPVEPVQRLIRCAHYHLPVGMIPAANAGAGSPITNAGSIALANAECLAGLVLHQLKNPGAPFLYGYNIATLLTISGRPNGHPGGWTGLSTGNGKRAGKKIFTIDLTMRQKKLCPAIFPKPNRLMSSPKSMTSLQGEAENHDRQGKPFSRRYLPGRNGSDIVEN